MNPIISLPFLIIATLAILICVVVCSWRGSYGAPFKVRTSLVTIRCAAVFLLAGLLSNPGSWQHLSSTRKPSWIILQDTSQSMNHPVSSTITRAELASTIANQAADLAKKQDIPASILPFADSIGSPTDPATPIHNGTTTNITHALQQALQKTTAAGTPVAGVLLLSDGRQSGPTLNSDLSILTRLLQSANTHLYPVNLSAQTLVSDLSVHQPRASFSSFANQSIRIPFTLSATGLNTNSVTANLLDASGKILASKKITLPKQGGVTDHFDVTAPSASTHWKIDVPCQPDEMRLWNNSSLFHIKVLHSKTRVFLVEGAPYWDSKFLAQLLRSQSHIDLQSIHRLSDQRYFRINTGNQSETDSPVFPNTIEELCRYDMVILGKNTDPFLTPDHVALLRSYVRDFGGSLLFSRGKATSLDVPELEPLEPVTWGPTTHPEFRFSPTPDGETTGLFGQCLPPAKSSLWASLPMLSDAKQVLSVKPFTRVLAEGITSNAQHAKIPSFLVRRYGQGVTGLFNGDGLWKWDFYPEARDLGNCYEDFWNQTIQWMASYSEFLPGQDYSLRFPSYQCQANTSQVATIAYRGNSKSPAPVVHMTSPSGETQTLTPARTTDPSGHPIWRLSVTPQQHGIWSFKVSDPSSTNANFPESSLLVPAPILEADDITPDPAFLSDLAKCSNDTPIPADSIAPFLASHISPPPPSTQNEHAYWQPSWQSPTLACLIALTFAIEWFLRRRNGLA